MIAKLHSISNKTERRIIGLMSGTSLDGLDIAVCNLQGSGRCTKVAVEQFLTIPYPTPLVSKIREISSENISLAALCAWNVELGGQFAKWINECLYKWNISPSEIDLIASHGQTIFHHPRPFENVSKPSTLQIGDGDMIAHQTGIITLSDFRMKHIAAGGEGAPLAGYGDYLLFAEDQRDVVLLNIGGISNFTWLPKNHKTPLLCSDLGSGNALLDVWVRTHLGVSYDENGKTAAQGKVNLHFLKELKQHPFHELPFPKTTGLEEFNYQFILTCLNRSESTHLSNEDVLATLTAYSGETIAKGIKDLGLSAHFDLYISGGGLKNSTLITEILKGLPEAKLRSTEDKGVLPDAKEAILFAVLANECVAGKPGIFSGTGLPDIKMGKISLPG